MDATRRAVSEGVGSALLLVAVVGSGIMGERLASGNAAIALLANSVATGTALFAWIAIFAPISGAHFNPLVTAGAALRGDLAIREVPSFVAAQIAGALLGVAAANAMFGLPAFFVSHHGRSGAGPLLGEVIAAFGLVLVIESGVRTRSALLPYAVAAYVTAAYWFTSSTAFANPAVTLARALTDTFAGIRPSDVLPFIAAQCCGAALAVGFCRWLGPVAEGSSGKAIR